MDAREAVEAVWVTHGVRPDRVLVRADGTVGLLTEIDDDSRVRVGASESGEGGVPDGGTEFAPGRELGRGGRGSVVVARQRSLRREVALKQSLHPGVGDRELVEEGWALAHLAHPNVVPVHALVVLDGRPALAMKRISGRPWSELLEASRGTPGSTMAAPRLEEALRVLLEVTRAIEHAHRAGVVHLDLKPSNVMVGEFGEVYLLDWGLAARLGEDPAYLPAARDVDSPAGTPAYMAPEQAQGAGRELGTHTDVYLLGGMLHELLSGAPPHPGGSPYARMFHAVTGEIVDPPEGAPFALVRLARAALSREASARPPSATEFREGIETFLREQEGERLLDRARGEFESFARALASGSKGEVQRHFGGARFAVREAMRELRSRADARDLDRAIHLGMTEHALSEGALALANAYRSEVAGEVPELDARLAAAHEDETRARERRRALDRLGRDENMHVEHEVRAFTAMLLAAIFLGSTLVLAALERAGVGDSYLNMIAALTLGGVVLVPYAYSRRASLFPNRVITAVWGTCIATAIPMLGHWIVCRALDVPFRSALALTPLYHLLCFGALATFFDTRLWPAVLVQVFALCACATFPQFAYEVMAVGGVASITQVAYVWSLRR